MRADISREGDDNDNDDDDDNNNNNRNNIYEDDEDDEDENLHTIVPICKFGTKCYRKNPQHFRKFFFAFFFFFFLFLFSFSIFCYFSFLFIPIFVLYFLPDNRGIPTSLVGQVKKLPNMVPLLKLS